MAIAITCSRCGGRFSAPDKAAGRKTKCPSCGNSLIVPSNSTSGVVESPKIVTPAEAKENAKLINCDACGHKIAPSAPTCPQCGGVNKWIHPEIQRFINSLDQFSHLPRFNVNYERDVLKGYADVKRGGHALGDLGSKALIVGILCSILGAFLPGELAIVAWVLGPLGVFGGLVLMLVAGLGNTTATDYGVSFVIDFAKSPAAWQSNDDDFWKEVKSFFFANVSRRSGP